MTLRINIVFSFLVLLTMCGCRGKQEVLKVLDNEEFFTSGLAEFSGKIDNARRAGSRKAHFHVGNLLIYKDDIITGESQFRSFSTDFDDAGFRDWLRLTSPRILTVKGYAGNDLPDVYLEPGKSLTMRLDAETGECIFSGELAQVNNDLARAPKMADLDEINRKMENDSTFAPAEARAMYEVSDSVWRKELDAYLESSDLSVVGRRILANYPVFQKAYWLMLNEKLLEPESPEDYTPLREALLTDDNYIMAQKWPSGLVKNLASSSLLSRMGENAGKSTARDYKDAVMKYMKRYDAMNMFLGVSGMPMLAQLAVSRTLCKGGLLEKAKNVEEALAIVDTVAASYLPNPEVRKGVERYARQIFRKDRYEVRDTPEGKMLKGLLAKYAGKRVVLDFWASLCPPCLKEMAATRDVRVKFRDNPDWVVVYVTGEEITDRESYDKVVAKYLDGDESLYLDHEMYGRLTAMFDVGGYPHKVLFDRDGAVLQERYVFTPDWKGVEE